MKGKKLEGSRFLTFDDYFRNIISPHISWWIYGILPLIKFIVILINHLIPIVLCCSVWSLWLNQGETHKTCALWLRCPDSWSAVGRVSEVKPMNWDLSITPARWYLIWHLVSLHLGHLSFYSWVHMCITWAWRLFGLWTLHEAISQDNIFLYTKLSTIPPPTL
jgi:hypothetical protein